MKYKSRDSITLTTNILQTTFEITNEMDISYPCISSYGKYICVQWEYNVNYIIDHVSGSLFIVSNKVTFIVDKSCCSSYNSFNMFNLIDKYYLSKGMRLSYEISITVKIIHGPICNECNYDIYLIDDQTSCLSCGNNCSKCIDF